MPLDFYEANNEEYNDLVVSWTVDWCLSVLEDYCQYCSGGEHYWWGIAKLGTGLPGRVVEEVGVGKNVELFVRDDTNGPVCDWGKWGSISISICFALQLLLSLVHLTSNSKIKVSFVSIVSEL
ncbi:hypothetical protein Tco_0128427 [Tanacetum coccineum]